MLVKYNQLRVDCKVNFILLLHTLRPKLNGSHIADDIFKFIFFMEKMLYFGSSFIAFYARGPVNYKSALVQAMACHWTGGKPLPQKMGTWFTDSYIIHNALMAYPDSKVHRANMGPIWGRQDPDGPRVGPMNFAILVVPLWNKNDPRLIIVFTQYFNLVLSKCLLTYVAANIGRLYLANMA